VPAGRTAGQAGNDEHPAQAEGLSDFKSIFHLV